MQFPNLEIKEFTQAITNFCNQSPLPAEVKRLCLVDIVLKLDAESKRLMLSELHEREKPNQKEVVKSEQSV